MKKHSARYALAGAVSLLTFALYLPAVRNEFLWDDFDYISNNEHIRSLNAPFFQWTFSEFYLGNWHPLTWISHAVDYAIWGLNPAGHHFTNIALHAVNTLLVVFLALQLMELWKERAATGKNASFLEGPGIMIAAGAAGILFGLHPIHAQTALWVSDRKDLLCGLFFLLSLSAYAGHVRSLDAERAEGAAPATWKLTGCFVVSLAGFVCALMSKPMAVSLPVIMLVQDWHPFRRIRSWKGAAVVSAEKLPHIAITAALLLLAIRAQIAEGALKLTALIPAWARLLVTVKASIVYLGKMAAPVGLSPYYPYPELSEITVSEPQFAVPLLLLGAFSAAVAAAARRQRIWLAAWLSYLASLLPVSGIIQVGAQSMADRYAYVPSIFPLLLAGGGAAWIWTFLNSGGRRRAVLRACATAAALAVVLALAAGTRQQIRIWRNSLSLWNRVISLSPAGVPYAYINRGLAFRRQGRLDLAIRDFNSSLSVAPGFPAAYYNRGLALDAAGDTRAALSDLGKAIALQPQNEKIYNSRGLILKRLGLLDGALSDFTDAIRLNPASGTAYLNRGLTNGEMNRLDQAVDDLSAAIAINPGSSSAYTGRGLAYKRKGELARAMRDLDAAVRLNDSNAGAYLNRGVVWEALGRLDRALSDYSRAVSLKPADFLAYANRGIVYDKLGQRGEAIEDFSRALSLKRDFTAAYLYRGDLYLSEGMLELARQDYREACTRGSTEGCSNARRLGSR